MISIVIPSLSSGSNFFYQFRETSIFFGKACTIFSRKFTLFAALLGKIWRIFYWQEKLTFATTTSNSLKIHPYLLLSPRWCCWRCCNNNILHATLLLLMLLLQQFCCPWCDKSYCCCIDWDLVMKLLLLDWNQQVVVERSSPLSDFSRRAKLFKHSFGLFFFFSQKKTDDDYVLGFDTSNYCCWYISVGNNTTTCCRMWCCSALLSCLAWLDF